METVVKPAIATLLGSRHYVTGHHKAPKVHRYVALYSTIVEPHAMLNLSNLVLRNDLTSSLFYNSSTNK